MKMLIKRLFRRIRWLIIYQWPTLTLKSWPYESCKKCGKLLRIRWNVEDKYWQKVANVQDDGGGSLCIDCFIELAVIKDIKIPIDAFDINIFEPEWL